MRNDYHILIVEDNATERALLKSVLSKMDFDFKIHEAYSVKGAMEAIDTILPDLVLLDIGLPDGSGLELLKRFDREDRYADLPVILVSAFHDIDDKRRALNLGVTDFISKPIVAEDVTARVSVQIKFKKKLDDTRWASQKTNDGVKILYKQLDRANEKLKEVGRLKDEFISTVSHELRTPLTVIKESINIVYDATVGPINPDQKDFLETAKRNVDRLSRMINNVLDYQKLDSQFMKFAMEEGDINAIVQEVGNSFKLPLEKKGLGLEFRLQQDLPNISFDRDKIIQVVTNLIGNSMKFMEKGNIALITEKQGENFIQVSVKDQGLGIKPQDLDKLFKSFSQISTGMSRYAGGTGLGLALCKKIVEHHKGRVGVESVFGEGSTFYFILPTKEYLAQNGGQDAQKNTGS